MPRRRRNKNKNRQKEEDTSAGKINNNNNNNINVDDDEEEVDKISKLPDDVLILIISWLTVAEAVRTSILSTRWRGLHTYITRLDFSDTLKQLEIIPRVEDSEEEEEQQQQQVEEDLEKEEEHLKEVEEEEEVVEEEEEVVEEEEEEEEEEEVVEEEEEVVEEVVKEEEEEVKETECYKFVKKYASIIDHTLDTHNGGAILQEFRLHIPWYTYPYYDDNDQSTCPKKRCLIQKWLEFAFSKQVRIIHVRLDCSHRWALFPFFSSKNETLKELSLNSVDVDDEFLELLLSNFVALERLSIERSYRLSVVRFLGDLLVAPKLKHFVISECCEIKSVEIRDMTNLESLSLHRLPHHYKLVLENVPSLVDLDTCKNIGIQILSQGIISGQLVKLKLSSHPYHDISYDDVDDMCLPKLVKIKHMELEYSIRGDGNIRELFHFIEACPYMQKLKIRFVWHKCPSNYMYGRSAQYRIKAVTKTSYDHLKRVELVGLFGCPREYEFGSCIIGKATALEEMFAETRAYDNVIMERKAISRVWKYFRRKLPKSVNLVVE